MKRLVAVLVAGAVAVLGLLAFGAPAQAADTASVSVVHGIPKTPVNVFVNGKSTLSNFKPGSVAGPLQLAPGTYKVTIFAASNTKGTGTPVISGSATVEAGQNYSLVANLTAAGKPTLTAFVNDTSTMAAGMGRIIVRHTAAAPAVDVRANGKVAFKGLTNPNEAKANLPAGTISADVVLAGTSTVVIGPADVKLAEGTDTIVYAIGSASDKTLAPVVQTISGLDSAPGGVPGGTGGQADQHPGAPVWVYLVSLAGLALAVGTGSRLATTRR
ncbi:MAG: DUF4397 domain-containing protein [bacterium]